MCYGLVYGWKALDWGVVLGLGDDAPLEVVLSLEPEYVVGLLGQVPPLEE